MDTFKESLTKFVKIYTDDRCLAGLMIGIPSEELIEKELNLQKCVSQFEAAEEQDPQVLLNDAAAVLGNQNDCVGSQDREVVIEEIPDDQLYQMEKPQIVELLLEARTLLAGSRMSIRHLCRLLRMMKLQQEDSELEIIDLQRSVWHMSEDMYLLQTKAQLKDDELYNGEKHPVDLTDHVVRKKIQKIVSDYTKRCIDQCVRSAIAGIVRSPKVSAERDVDSERPDVQFIEVSQDSSGRMVQHGDSQETAENLPYVKPLSSETQGYDGSYEYTSESDNSEDATPAETADDIYEQSKECSGTRENEDTKAESEEFKQKNLEVGADPQATTDNAQATLDDSATREALSSTSKDSSGPTEFQDSQAAERPRLVSSDGELGSVRLDSPGDDVLSDSELYHRRRTTPDYQPPTSRVYGVCSELVTVPFSQTTSAKWTTESMYTYSRDLRDIYQMANYDIVNSEQLLDVHFHFGDNTEIIEEVVPAIRIADPEHNEVALREYLDAIPLFRNQEDDLVVEDVGPEMENEIGLANLPNPVQTQRVVDEVIVLVPDNDQVVENPPPDSTQANPDLDDTLHDNDSDSTIKNASSTMSFDSALLPLRDTPIATSWADRPMVYPSADVLRGMMLQTSAGAGLEDVDVPDVQYKSTTEEKITAMVIAKQSDNKIETEPMLVSPGSVVPGGSDAVDTFATPSDVQIEGSSSANRIAPEDSQEKDVTTDQAGATTPNFKPLEAKTEESDVGITAERDNFLIQDSDSSQAQLEPTEAENLVLFHKQHDNQLYTAFNIDSGQYKGHGCVSETRSADGTIEHSLPNSSYLVEGNICSEDGLLCWSEHAEHSPQSHSSHCSPMGKQLSPFGSQRYPKIDREEEFQTVPFEPDPEELAERAKGKAEFTKQFNPTDTPDGPVEAAIAKKARDRMEFHTHRQQLTFDDPDVKFHGKHSKVANRSGRNLPTQKDKKQNRAPSNEREDRHSLSRKPSSKTNTLAAYRTENYPKYDDSRVEVPLGKCQTSATLKPETISAYQSHSKLTAKPEISHEGKCLQGPSGQRQVSARSRHQDPVFVSDFTDKGTPSYTKPKTNKTGTPGTKSEYNAKYCVKKTKEKSKAGRERETKSDSKAENEQPRFINNIWDQEAETSFVTEYHAHYTATQVEESQAGPAEKKTPKKSRKPKMPDCFVDPHQSPAKRRAAQNK